MPVFSARRRALALLCAAGLTGGCVSPGGPPAPASPVAVAAGSAVDDEAVLKAARLAAQAAPAADYRISPTDLVEITVFQQPELERKLRVSQNGTVSLPLVGTVEIGGKTLNEAQTALSDKLREFVINPQVTVFVREYANKKFVVLGEVQKPGSYDLPTENKLTVMEAVALAGGFTPIAAPDRTRVIRAVDGQSQTIPIVVSDITKRGEKDKDISLQAGDVVYVPQSFF